MDRSDKATNKAMSAAYKYAALQAFAIPTEGDNDADASTPEVVEDVDPDDEATGAPLIRVMVPGRDKPYFTSTERSEALDVYDKLTQRINESTKIPDVEKPAKLKALAALNSWIADAPEEDI